MGRRGAIYCFLVVAMLVPWAVGQPVDDALETTEPVPWEFEGRDYVAPEDTDTAAPFRTPEEKAEEDAFTRRMAETYAEDDAQGSAADQAPAPTPTSVPDMFRVFLNMVLILCVMLGIVVLTVYFFRKYAAKTPLLMGQQLGRVIGKVSLGQRATLHYVRTGGRILVIGVGQSSITPVAEFDEEAFDGILTTAPEASGAPPSREDFLEALQEASGKSKAAPMTAEDDELTQLRADLQRLRHYLREGGRDQES